MIRVLLEGSRLTRAQLGEALRSDGAAALIEEGDARRDLPARLDSLAPDVLVLEAEGDEQIGELLARADVRGVPVVLLVARSDGAWANAALRAGVRAVLPRNAPDLAAAIAAVAAGYVVLHPDAVGPLVPAGGAVVHRREDQTLTAREIEVLRMMAEGLANKAIAARMGISEHTVKFHIGSIFAKLHAGSRTEAVTMGARQGLVIL